MFIIVDFGICWYVVVVFGVRGCYETFFWARNSRPTETT